MKRILITLVLLVPLLVKAQSTAAGYKVEDKYVYYGEVVKVDTSLTALDLYKDARLFLTKLALTNTTITMDDKVAGTLAVDVQEPSTYKTATGIGSSPMTLKYSIKLELKKGRYRYTFDNIIITYEEDSRNVPHTLYDLDKSASGMLGNPRSKRILKTVNTLFLNKIDLLSNNMNKKSDDF